MSDDDDEDEDDSDNRPFLACGTGRQCCGNCRFFAATGSEPEMGPVVGFCRRYPPEVGGWPDVEERDWCGEWRFWKAE